MIGVYVSFVGATVGSFLFVLATRDSYVESVIGRSTCGNCQQTLRAIDLIPVFSYLLLKGKCHFCKSRFSIHYLIIELLCGTLFLLSWLLIGFQLELLLAILLISLLILISITDLHRMLIPNALLVCFAIPLIALRFFYLPSYEITIYFVVLSTCVFVVLIVSSFLKKLGGGDVKLFLLLMLLFGIELLLFILLLSSLFTLMVAFVLIKKQRLGINGKIPFAPFISFATLLVYFLTI